MNNMASRYFLVFFYLSIAAILFSCNADQQKKVDIENFDFSTTDASELYFKNIRESYYHIEEKEGIRIYRLKDYDDIDSSLLRPIIVFHWRVDKAFLMLEFGNDINPENINIQLGDEQVAHQVIQIKDHLVLANDIYEAVIDEKDIFLNRDGAATPLFGAITEKSNFSLVLYDFFRFTNVY